MIQLFGNPLSIQGGAAPLQGGYNPQQAANPQQPAPIVAPRPAVASKPATPRVVQVSVKFYKPDPNSQQVYNSQGQPLSYEQYIAQGGLPNYSNVLHQAVPGTQTPLPVAQPLQALQPQPNIQADAYQQFAQSAAQAGLGVDDYLKYLTGSVTGDERNKINSGLGIPELYKQLFTSAPKTQDLYTQAYSQAGLGDLKASITAKLAEVNRIQSAYTEKEGKVNENPFLSEASRVGRLRILDDKRLHEIGNLNNELQSMQDLYNNGVNEVNSVVSRTTQDFSNDQQVNALKLTYLQQQAEQQLADLKDTKTQAAYKYLPDYLKAKAAATKPDTIGSNETGFYRWNPTTSTFEQVIAPQVTPNFSVNPITGEYYDTKTGRTQSGGLPTVSGKPATDAQNQSATYALRVQQAGQAIDSVANKIVGMNPLKYEAEKRLPSYLQSAEYQAYDQAARNLVNAVLRRESGAAISIGEFENAYAQYLPKPGDTAQTLAQKSQNRAAILNGLVQSAGPAYDSLSGSSGGNPNDPLGLFQPAGKASASNARTDRHNNPTAFTTTIAKQAGLVLGKDYVVGDPFPNNPNIFTAKLIGDPIAQTIKVIDKIGFTTQSGQPRWTYTNSIPQTKNWNSLSYDQKKQVVAQMYQHEGGTGLKQYFA